MTLLAKRYAEALYALSKQHGVADAVAAQVQAMHGVLTTPGARALFTGPNVSREQRLAMLGKLTAGSHPFVANLVGVLDRRHRLEVLFDLHPALRVLVMRDRGEVEGVVETPQVLGEAEMASLTELARRLSGKTVHLVQKHKPELLGGVRLCVGNVLYDGSLQASLVLLERRMLQSSLG